MAGCFTLGTLTNQSQAAFQEPRLPVVTDPGADHQPLTQESYVNLPAITLCNTDSPLRYMDIAIPCNKKGADSVGLRWWMLAQEGVCMSGTISHEHPWEIVPDLYFYRDPEEIEREEQTAAKKAVTKEEFQSEQTASAPKFTAIQPRVTGWSKGTQALSYESDPAKIKNACHPVHIPVKNSVFLLKDWKTLEASKAGFSPPLLVLAITGRSSDAEVVKRKHHQSLNESCLLHEVDGGKCVDMSHTFHFRENMISGPPVERQSDLGLFRRPAPTVIEAPAEPVLREENL
ncbi:hypothetical protein HPG69_002574 [Diceros bicornis minor]|uniref:40S ribosomal protein SA n=1 Tax=Diceros bicornis minor TaxID=77932 RepID=A0A7J7FP92_DICBM|nr:hypothetical protein HPG69_002574 [Diceros bicornis minor]